PITGSPLAKRGGEVPPVGASRCRPRGDRFDSCAESSSGGRTARLGGTAGPSFKLHGFVGWAATLLLLFFVREAAARHSCRAVGTRRSAPTAHLRARPRPFARLPASSAVRPAARRLPPLYTRACLVAHALTVAG